MKRKLALISVFVALCIAATILPPALPSSFWGYSSQAGNITVMVNGHQAVKTSTFLYQGKPVYALDVLMDYVKAGTIATFYLNGVKVASAQLNSGTNMRLDLFAVRRLWR